MAFPIIPRKRSGSAGNPTSLQLGELAVNCATGELFLGADEGVTLLNGPVAAGTIPTIFNGNNSATTFAPISGYTSTNASAYLVSVGGLDQRPTIDYTITAANGGSIVFATAPALNAAISIRAIQSGEGGGAGTGTVTSITAGDGLAGGTITESGTISLAAITTAQSEVGSSTLVPVISINDKGQVTSLTTAAISGGGAPLATTAPAALATTAVVGLSTAAARADHQHIFPSAADVGALGATASAGGDLTGNYPSPTLAAITTAQSNVGGELVIPVISTDAKGRVTSLATVACSALTTAQIAGLSTTAPAALATSAVVGLSTFAARADHQHVFPTAANVGALGATAAAGGDLTGNYPNPTLAAITTAQSNVGSPRIVPIISIDSSGRVTQLTSAAIAISINVNYLVVAGGGGGGRESFSTGMGGGGGAGGFLTGQLTVDVNNTYTVTVGAGGAIYGPGPTGAVGGSGANSTFASLIALGGGGGGGGTANPANGANGGSGGGACSNLGGSTFGSGTVGQGNRGGLAGGTGTSGGGGGGGAGAVGGDRSTGTGGSGGAGLSSSLSGSAVTYAGGGGGSGSTVRGLGGAGGGGAGALYNSTNAVSGTINTGGGGGGASNLGSTAGTTGGSGIVVISYPTTNALASATGSFTQTTSGGNYIFTFTGSGTITF